ncbi:MAG: DUF2306 domain-containing protein [Vulcanimicrobiota bacterium]
MRYLVLGIYSYTVWLMLQISLQYLSIRDDVAFLAIKQDYTPLLHYRLAFFTHVFSSILVLPAGFTQFSKNWRIHRYAGRLYAYVTLLLAGPSGLVIGLYANGGWSSRLAFLTLAGLWIFFTAMGVKSARRRDFKAHRRWMLRSFSLALSAITLRAWKLALVLAFHPRPMDVYRVVAWLGWTLNLAVAEWLILVGAKRGDQSQKPTALD